MQGLDKKNISVMIIGGGASGFFSAVNLAHLRNDLDITILEKSSKVLSKVKASGGGRCNVTHQCFDDSQLVKYYPRGERELRQVFSRFNANDTVKWFEGRGVKLKTEDDGRMFPETDKSETIINCFLTEARTHKVKIKTGCEVFSIRKEGDRFHLKTSLGALNCDLLVCASGGSSKSGSYSIFERLGHTIETPVPSLFTFNMPGEKWMKSLQGVSVPMAEVRLAGNRSGMSGPLLITHWGLSGPAVLKLSAWKARELQIMGYNTGIVVNWIFPAGREKAMERLLQLKKERLRSVPQNTPAFDLPRRLWEELCKRSLNSMENTWSEISNNDLGRLCDTLCCCNLKMEGKTTFKEEFVTCGGVSLKEVDLRTMQSKIVPGLYFCGELLDIDGMTGGFNFQNAWSTGFVAASHIAGNT